MLATEWLGLRGWARSSRRTRKTRETRSTKNSRNSSLSEEPSPACRGEHRRVYDPEKPRRSNNPKKTTRHLPQNNTSFFQKYALVFSLTSASFFRPYKMGSHIGSDEKHKKQIHNAQSVNDLFATINSCH